jgi:hypothetical protein
MSHHVITPATVYCKDTQGSFVTGEASAGRRASSLQPERIVNDVEGEHLTMGVKTYSDVVKVVTSENIVPLLGSVQDDVPLVMAKLPDQITPLPENQIGIALPFPDADDFSIAKIDDHIWNRKQRHLFADPDTDNLAVKREIHRVVDGESLLPVGNGRRKAFHGSSEVLFSKHSSCENPLSKKDSEASRR